MAWGNGELHNVHTGAGRIGMVGAGASVGAGHPHSLDVANHELLIHAAIPDGDSAAGAARQLEFEEKLHAGIDLDTVSCIRDNSSFDARYEL